MTDMRTRVSDSVIMKGIIAFFCGFVLMLGLSIVLRDTESKKLDKTEVSPQGLTEWNTGEVIVTRFCDETNLIYTSWSSGVGGGIAVVSGGCGSR